MKSFLWLPLFFLLPTVACADNAWQYSKQIERSMTVTGTIEVNRDGSVRGYTLDQQEKLLPEVVEIIGKVAPTWKFEPFSSPNRSFSATTTMSIRVVADKLDGDRYGLYVRGVSFKDDDPADGITYRVRSLPRYPREALQAGVGGTVYLVASINRQGTVDHVVAQQVNLRALGDKDAMARLRKDFSQASIDAAKKWTFNVPASAKPGDSHWDVQIPVNFSVLAKGEKQPELEYGQWEPYVPGPLQPIPWEQDHVADGNNADAIPGDGVFTPDKRFALLTPLSD
ncbi:MAG TPA: hypothetical protein VN693_03325 [Rhodanobacteraceae bacterium]|nr:hypothetical protein [Rhodanobacteraceae bacterium]